ncbi:nSTAND1 domain-containing NTPase [Streptomyces hesseae]|uniref:Trypsin-like peptidase domain-containing protein n=1 Tax=Streptomyces hesseae TaxID=3075519 RepID=A0ABU2SL62_9ACTN|nr:trypsin-like peptidase domain-containing protein [Streptomyces sp. DSM 40473]MDT0449632.1 trypsin-like peptidase domain-containing protein [Streptomyces sp. DSM 40473]
MPGPVPNPGIARLWSHGAPLGAGFLAAPRTVLTCGHVISSSAGKPESEPLPPGLPVELDFPLAGRPARRRTASLVRHIPVAADGTGDIAVLSLTEDPPAGVAPVRLLDVDSVRDHPFTAFGFPAGDDEGVWSLGTIVDERGRGWVQIESTGACEILQGFSGTPLWDDRLKGVVGMVVATDRRFVGRAAYALTLDTLLDAHPELARHASPDSPFRGLLPFREQDAAHYFGRSAQIAELTEAVTTSGVVPVVGASGVGKSSLVRAGLLPALRRRGDYSAVTLVPEPAVRAEHMLASALLPLLDALPGEEDAPGDMGERLDRLARRLRDGAAAPLVTEAVSRSGTSQLLLFVDQFEVLFRCPPDEADALVEHALRMTEWRTGDGGPLVRLVFTLRLDFLKAMRRFPALERACDTSAFFVNKLAGEQLREVVLAPVDSFHGAVRFEDRLAERLLADAGSSPGALPLLEFALTLLWERQVKGVLTHAAYEETGRVAGALATHAERAVKERLGDRRDEVRRLFVQLVRPGDGAADNPVDTGRTARRPELHPDCWEAAQLLATQRIVHLDHASDGVETVALAHEAVLEHWPTLRSWVDADREFRAWQEHLRARMSRWELSDRDRALLMRGSELSEAQRRLRDRQDDIPEAERAYIRASAEWRRRRRLRAALAGTAVLTAMTGLAGAGLVSVRDGKAAELSAGLVQEAQRQAGSRLETSALLSVAAWRTASTQQARDNLFDRYLSDARYDAVLPATGTVAETALDDSGQVIAVRTGAGRLTVWRVAASGGISRLVDMDNVSAVAVSPDGTRLALGGDGNSIGVWDVPGRKVLSTLRGAASTASADQRPDQLRFDRTGHRLVSHPPADDTAQVWDLDRPTAPAVTLRAPTGTYGEATEFAFDASGEHVVASHIGDDYHVWDARGGLPVPKKGPAEGPGLPVVSFLSGPHPVVAQCVDGRWHLTDPADGTTDPRLARTIPCDATAELAGVSDQVVLARRNGTVTVHDAHTGRQLSQFDEEEASGGRYTRYVLSNGSRRIVRARGTEILAMTAPAPDSLGTVGWIGGSSPEGRNGDAETAQFSPSGRYLATVRVDSTVTLWDPATGRRVATDGAAKDGGVPGHAVFDPAEKILAVSDTTDPTVTLYSLPGLHALRRLRLDLPTGTPPRAGAVAGMGFDARGHLTALAGGAVSRWDITTGEESGRPMLFTGDASVEQRDYSTTMAVRPRSGQAAVTTPDRRGVEIWDLENRRRVKVIVPDFTAPLLDWYRAVRYSADGTRLMLVSQDGETEIRDVGTGRKLIGIPAAPSRYTAFLDRSTRVVSMRKGAFEVWGPEGLIARTRTPAAAQVRAVVPSPDGERMLLTTGKDLDVRFRLEQASPDAWAAGLCSRVTRDITHGDMGTVRYGFLERNLLGVTACARG